MKAHGGGWVHGVHAAHMQQHARVHAGVAKQKRQPAARARAPTTTTLAFEGAKPAGITSCTVWPLLMSWPVGALLTVPYWKVLRSEGGTRGRAGAAGGRVRSRVACMWRFRVG